MRGSSLFGVRIMLVFTAIMLYLGANFCVLYFCARGGRRTYQSARRSLRAQAKIRITFDRAHEPLSVSIARADRRARYLIAPRSYADAERCNPV